MKEMTKEVLMRHMELYAKVRRRHGGDVLSDEMERCAKEGQELPKYVPVATIFR
ncbi:MAG: hypothetical protein GY906_23765 [bacterium]|nr:hypothetical protein [bacterium]